MGNTGFSVILIVIFVGVFSFSPSLADSIHCEILARNLAEDIAPVNQFQWIEHSRLSWSDFRGDAKNSDGESAAATNCGIGFKTNFGEPGKPAIIVYNTFYVNKSWVRADAKIPSILDHEQGHFDLCEVYTRKLRAQMANVDMNLPDVKYELMRVYSDVCNAYEMRQQAYELATNHGTDIARQKLWDDEIARELKLIYGPTTFA